MFGNRQPSLDVFVYQGLPGCKRLLSDISIRWGCLHSILQLVWKENRLDFFHIKEMANLLVVWPQQINIPRSTDNAILDFG